MDTESAQLQEHGSIPSSVVLCGLFTTALTLTGLYFLNHAVPDLNPMGLYVWFAVPVGAIIVGLLASCGYGLMAWWCGIRMPKGLVVAIVLLQVGAYFIAQYIEFRGLGLAYVDGTAVGFWEYFDAVTRSYTYTADSTSSHSTSSEVGAFGYVFRLLEIAGFSLAAVFYDSVLQGKAYCDLCKVYKRSNTAACLPAGITPRKIKKKDVDGGIAYEKEKDEAAAAGVQQTEELIAMLRDGDGAGFLEKLKDTRVSSREAQKLTSWVQFELTKCPRCSEGELQANMHVKMQEGVGVTMIAKCIVAPSVVEQL